jgi:pyridinium-3,5-bisthiocarboxylic acid mononucleotide nickel chelatase
MKTLYLDCFAGMSGDMFLGALIDVGLDPQVLIAELDKLPVEGYQIQVARVDKQGLQAVQFGVLLSEAAGERLADSVYVETDQPGAQAEHDSQPDSTSEEGGENQHTHTTSLPQILAIIQGSALSERVKTLASHIFTRLAEAEGDVHGLPKEQVHFHEVGGVDAIVDIVGAAIGIEQLGIEAIYAAPVPLGSGFIHSQHGTYPVPAPATAYLLRGAPVYTNQVRGELITPTGAAILTSIVHGFGAMPEMLVQAVGYGAGTRNRQYPNVLRAFLGESEWFTQRAQATARAPRAPYPKQHEAPVGETGYHESAAMVIEANIDDMNPQLFENLMEKLLAAGALDVLTIPVQMKKSRPGILLHVLASPASVDDLLEIIYTESTSIGARTYPVTKRMLQRETRVVETPFGLLPVKIAWLGEKVVNVAPEYEDSREAARRSGVALKDVLAAAVASARQAVKNHTPGD